MTSVYPLAHNSIGWLHLGTLKMFECGCLADVLPPCTRCIWLLSLPKDWSDVAVPLLAQKLCA